MARPPLNHEPPLEPPPPDVERVPTPKPPLRPLTWWQRLRLWLRRVTGYD